VKHFADFEKDMTARLGTLTSNYEQALDRLQKELVKAEMLDEATAVQGEREKIKTVLKGYTDQLSALTGPVATNVTRAAAMAVTRTPSLALGKPVFNPNHPYLVIDLSHKTKAKEYPVTTLADVPKKGWTDEYKTDKLVLKKIEPGTFVMGSPPDEVGRGGSERQHEVTLTQAFYIGVFEVTQKQWERVMDNWPSRFNNAQCRDTRPVEKVTYNDIRGPRNGTDWPATNSVDTASFMALLRARTGRVFDLPTEAQWEYACRAGTTTALNSGKNLISPRDVCPNLSEVGRYKGNAEKTDSNGGTDTGTAKVGSYLSNAWGLYDMHGNVREWCLDWRGDYSGTEIDPKGPTSGQRRVHRGGCFNFSANGCRSADRSGDPPDYVCDDIGFRIALTLNVPTTKNNQAISRLLKEGGRDEKTDGSATALAKPEQAKTALGGKADQVSALTRSEATSATRATTTLKSAMAAGISDAKKDLYLVIDLSRGPMAESYPATTLADMPKGGWTDEYKTDKLVLRKIAPGTFVMGSPKDELGRAVIETEHKVTLTRGYYIGVFEVTQRQWERVMGKWPSFFSNVTCRATRPVERVNYYDIRGANSGADWPASNSVDTTSFMGRMQARTGKAFDLPSEAQWEYACRAGMACALDNGKNLAAKESDSYLAEIGRYRCNGGAVKEGDGDTSIGTAKVGSYLANAWGLYDMHGNVWEWCLDLRGEYSSEENDPRGSNTGSDRIMRGGGFDCGQGNCRSASRGRGVPAPRNQNAGFRTAIPLNQP
jgi:formylglycine-generating enzyme required for sulfatase activity